MIRRDRLIRICTAALILNLCFIWGNSLLPAELSRAFSDWVKGLLSGVSTETVAATGGSGMLRKIAHFTEFAALGFLLRWRCLLLGKKSGRPLVWGALAACVDEAIQLFIPGRGPGLGDVLIDVCGVAAGMLLLRTGYALWRKNHKTNGGK